VKFQLIEMEIEMEIALTIALIHVEMDPMNGV